MANKNITILIGIITVIGVILGVIAFIMHFTKTETFKAQSCSKTESFKAPRCLKRQDIANINKIERYMIKNTRSDVGKLFEYPKLNVQQTIDKIISNISKTSPIKIKKLADYMAKLPHRKIKHFITLMFGAHILRKHRSVSKALAAPYLPNLLNTNQVNGIDKVSTSLRNANLQLRPEPAAPPPLGVGVVEERYTTCQIVLKILAEQINLLWREGSSKACVAAVAALESAFMAEGAEDGEGEAIDADLTWIAARYGCKSMAKWSGEYLSAKLMTNFGC